MPVVQFRAQPALLRVQLKRPSTRAPFKRTANRFLQLRQPRARSRRNANFAPPPGSSSSSITSGGARSSLIVHLDAAEPRRRRCPRAPVSTWARRSCSMWVTRVDDVQEQRGLACLRQRRSKRRDELMRQVANEAHGIDEQDRVAVLQRAPGGSWDRASRTTDPWRSNSASASALNNVVLPAFV